MPAHRRKLFAWLTAILAVLAGGGTLVVTLTSDDQVPPATVTVPVDGLDAGTADDRQITVPQKTVEQIAPALEDSLREPPAATPTEQLDAITRAADENRATTTALPTAGATAGFAGCRTSFVNNQSSRNGVRPIWQDDHYTVSPNVPGWADVNAVVALFNRSSLQASSHFVIDAEGHCAYIVPIERKAWTQAGANPFAISYEIIATGREAQYLPLAGMKKLAAVQKEVSRRTGIPMRRGSTNGGCAGGRPGIVQHKDHGICGGGHVDITPFSIDTVVRQTIALAGGSSTTCDLACQRRQRHAAAHRELRARRCAPIDKTRSARCLTLHRRVRALHKLGVTF